MKKVALIVSALALLLVGCSSKTYFECKNPTETKDGRVLCEK